MYIQRYSYFLTTIVAVISLAIIPAELKAEGNTQFNTDLLNLEDKNNIDFNKFSNPGYIVPGIYTLDIKMNSESFPEQKIPFYAGKTDSAMSRICLSPDIVKTIGFKEEIIKKVTWWHDGECLNLDDLPGFTATGDLSSATLNLTVPQAYLEYRTENWDPPSLWDNGVAGIFFDYNLLANITRSLKTHNNEHHVSANGTAGVNLGAWRFRGDWQTQIANTGSKNDFRWTRLYAYRAITQLKAKLTIGEDYLESDLFDSIRYIGIGLRSSLLMEPPNLRGYAPEITGVANTNATVIISQQGRIIRQEQVAPGPFRIQTLSDVTTGKLDVTVREQDGTEQQFQVDTATVPYLTRPGSVRYKLAAGRPSDVRHHTQGDSFAMGEFSWGVSNGWSLFGGFIGSKNYQSVNTGVGRDLFSFGAFSLDITHARAAFSGGKKTAGNSYRINYSKRFDEYDSSIQFAGYRFSEQDYIAFSEFISSNNYSDINGHNKEMYVISLNKNFRDIELSGYINYSHQTYWDKPSSERLSLMIAKNINLDKIKNINLSLSAFRTKYSGSDKNDDGFYLSASIPWGDNGSIGYSVQTTSEDTINRATYYDQINNRVNYQLSTGASDKGVSAGAYLTYHGNRAKLTANASYNNNDYASAGFGAQGGITLTKEGADIHRQSIFGGTRLMIDTDGIAGIPITDRGAPVKSNYFGKLVIPDVNSYYRNKIKVDLNEIPENAEVDNSVVEATLTEGAIGYRKVGVLSGEKRMVSIRTREGQYPPFGAQVINRSGRNTGIVNDSGYTYVSGINPGESMFVIWGDNKACKITFPENLSKSGSGLLLTCIPESVNRFDEMNKEKK
ncbi:TPA: fimbria/pilus outer membrane usher protein [Morganella morganii]|nr:fimbria/pilus outer membrane usher protein [Morganella morganii]